MLVNSVAHANKFPAHFPTKIHYTGRPSWPIVWLARKSRYSRSSEAGLTSGQLPHGGRSLYYPCLLPSDAFALCLARPPFRCPRQAQLSRVQNTRASAGVEREADWPTSLKWREAIFALSFSPVLGVGERERECDPLERRATANRIPPTVLEAMVDKWLGPFWLIGFFRWVRGCAKGKRERIRDSVEINSEGALG